MIALYLQQLLPSPRFNELRINSLKEQVDAMKREIKDLQKMVSG